jgi:hypothetical protein
MTIPPQPYTVGGAARSGAQTGKKALTGNYQAIILAEFALCIGFTIFAPFTTSAAKEGLSPYVGKDIVKVAAITILFLLLGMVSQASQGAARLAAWLGGLVLITDGLAEAATIGKILQLGTGALAQADSGTSETQNG